MQPGLIYGIIGPNGSGKSTLHRRHHPATKLTRGELLFDGEEYHRRPAVPGWPASGVARTFQTVRLLPDLNVRGQHPARRRRGRRGRRRARRSCAACSGRSTSPVVPTRSSGPG